MASGPVPSSAVETESRLRAIEALVRDEAGVVHDGRLSQQSLDGQYAALDYYQTGTGSPEGLIDAPRGSIYIDKVATLGCYSWHKSTTLGTLTGWIPGRGRTAWRDLVRWDAAGYTYSDLGTLSASFAPYTGQPGGIYYRRVDGAVEWWLRSIQANASISADSLVDLFIPNVDLPVGIWADDGTWPIKGRNESYGLTIWKPSGSNVKLTLRVDSALSSGAIVFSTDGGVTATILSRDDIWPSSLPGDDHEGTPTP